MSKAVVVHEAARLEYLEATAWYEARGPGLGADLVEALDEAMARVLPIAQHAATVKRGVQIVRVPVRRFPYRLIVADLPDVALVVAIAHKHRRPDYWAGRLPSAPP